MGQGTAFLIERFIRYYNVDMKDAKIQDIAKFKSFNDFFTRELKKMRVPSSAMKMHWRNRLTAR